MNHTIRPTLIVLGSGVLAAVALTALPTLAEPPGQPEPLPVDPNAQQSVVARKRPIVESESPNRQTVRPEDIVDPGERPGQCELTPSELLLVSNIRQTLASLAEREARVAGREAALKAIQSKVRADLSQMAVLRESVEARVRVIERYQLRMDQVRDTEKRLDTLAATAAKSLETLANAEKAVAEKKNDNDNKKPGWQAERIRQLAAILKKMKPAQAAPILARQTDDVAIGALEALGSRTAGKILSQMPTERASALAQKLVARPIAAAPGGAK